LDRKAKTSAVTFVAGDGAELRTVTVPAALEGGRGVFATPAGQVVLAASSDDPARMLWLIPANGAPRKLDIDTRAWSGPSFRLSPDRKHIVYFSGQDLRELWALENVVPVTGKR
jgi:hypothetical protein